MKTQSMPNFEYRKIYRREKERTYLVGIYFERKTNTYKQTLEGRLENTKGCYVVKY
jgi:hypothetical protein